MTNRDDFGLGMYVSTDHLPSKHRSHHNLSYQVREEFENMPELARMKSRKSGAGGMRGTKPTREYYQPPSMNFSSKNQRNGAKVHFQSPPRTKVSPTPLAGELKSALKRSKSFTNSDLTEMHAAIAGGFEREAFPIEYQGLIKTAIHDPNVLSSRQLMELVRLICNKAVESMQNFLPAAQMCFSIIEKERGTTFLESLLHACREWFNERDKLLRCTFSSSNSMMVQSIGGSKRWTTYISFLTELYLRLMSQHRQSALNHHMEYVENANSETSHHTLTLLTLLYECSQIILKPPGVNDIAEIECLRSLLLTVGNHLEKEAPQKMQQLVSSLRDAFINPSVTAQIRKTILELVELHASNWHLELPQSVYYFPYTSINRR